MTRKARGCTEALTSNPPTCGSPSTWYTSAVSAEIATLLTRVVDTPGTCMTFPENSRGACINTRQAGR